MVVIDKLVTYPYFISMKLNYKVVRIVEYIYERICRLAYIHMTTIFHQDVKFTFTFWKDLFR